MWQYSKDWGACIYRLGAEGEPIHSLFSEAETLLSFDILDLKKRKRCCGV